MNGGVSTHRSAGLAARTCSAACVRMVDHREGAGGKPHGFYLFLRMMFGLLLICVGQDVEKVRVSRLPRPAIPERGPPLVAHLVEHVRGSPTCTVYIYYLF